MKRKHFKEYYIACSRTQKIFVDILGNKCRFDRGGEVRLQTYRLFCSTKKLVDTMIGSAQLVALLMFCCIHGSLQLKDFGLRDNLDYLVNLEKGDDWERQFGAGGSTIVAAFYTPILRYQLKDVSPKEYSEEMVRTLNKNLTKIILNVYDKFEETFLTKLEKKKGKRFAAEAKLQGELNKAFFDWQQEGGWREYVANKRPAMLFEKIRIEIEDIFAKQLGMDTYEETVKKMVKHQFVEDHYQAREVLYTPPWATVQRNGMWHGAHEHNDAKYSGVYFLQVPEGSGALILRDPRSVSNSGYEIQPKEGEIILFPAWLRHEVVTSHFEDDRTTSRVSLAWNTMGQYLETLSLKPTKLLKKIMILNN